MNTSAPSNYLRNIIGQYMVELGQNDKVTLVNADLMGTCRNNLFVQKYPERSFNVGIAEQNMISFSAGLANEGFIPYAFSMAPFISMRACEQCRTDVAYGRLNVRLMATYAGCSGGISGVTHWGIEDCAIMCGIPGITVIEISDAVQAKKILKLSVDYKGPMYIRSGIEPVAEIYSEDYKFEVGKASTIVEGEDGAFICSGIVVQYAIKASESIKEKYGKSIKVVDMFTIKPIDRNAIINAAKTGKIIVAQDHNIIGGLGSAVATVLAEEGLSIKFKIVGIPDDFYPMAHSGFLYHKFGYDTDGLENAMIKLFDK